MLSNAHQELKHWTRKADVLTSIHNMTRFALTVYEPFLTLQIHVDLEFSTEVHESTTSFHRFPHSNFKYFLTLFSKFFSSFPHGTCSLSVSRHYLALEGIYLPFRAAFPSNPTLRRRVERLEHKAGRGSHPLRHRVPTDLCLGQVGQSPL